MTEKREKQSVQGDGLKSGWRPVYTKLLTSSRLSRLDEKKKHLESNQPRMPQVTYCVNATELKGGSDCAAHTCLSPADWTPLHKKSRWGQNRLCWCWRSLSRRWVRRRWTARSSCSTLQKVFNKDDRSLSVMQNKTINVRSLHQKIRVPGVVLFLLSSLKPCRVFTPLWSRLDIKPSFTGQ